VASDEDRRCRRGALGVPGTHARRSLRHRAFIALLANAGPLEMFWDMASIEQKSPAASIFALRYDGSTF